MIENNELCQTGMNYNTIPEIPTQNIKNGENAPKSGVASFIFHLI